MAAFAPQHLRCPRPVFWALEPEGVAHTTVMTVWRTRRQRHLVALGDHVRLTVGSGYARAQTFDRRGGDIKAGIGGRPGLAAWFRLRHCKFGGRGPYSGFAGLGRTGGTRHRAGTQGLRNAGELLDGGRHADQDEAPDRGYRARDDPRLIRVEVIDRKTETDRDQSDPRDQGTARKQDERHNSYSPRRRVL